MEGHADPSFRDERPPLEPDRTRYVRMHPMIRWCFFLALASGAVLVVLKLYERELVSPDWIATVDRSMFLLTLLTAFFLSGVVLGVTINVFSELFLRMKNHFYDADPGEENIAPFNDVTNKLPTVGTGAKHKHQPENGSSP